MLKMMSGQEEGLINHGAEELTKEFVKDLQDASNE